MWEETMGALGGFYINALNKQQRARFIADHQIKATLMLALELKQQAKYAFEQAFKIGELVTFTEGDLSIRVQSELTDAGLLHLECHVATADKNLKQALYLTPNETLTSLVEGDEGLKLTVSAYQR